jgi:hypothetical protein
MPFLDLRPLIRSWEINKWLLRKARNARGPSVHAAQRRVNNFPLMCDLAQLGRRQQCFKWSFGLQEQELKFRVGTAGSQNGNFDLKISSGHLSRVASSMSWEVLSFIGLAKRQ